MKHNVVYNVDHRHDYFSEKKQDLLNLLKCDNAVFANTVIDYR